MSTPSRAPLSVVLIAQNAAHQLDACLSSASFADEIVLVDSGSTDATRELAHKHGARVVAKDWLGFGRQKQFAVEQARHDWVLALDWHPDGEHLAVPCANGTVNLLNTTKGYVRLLGRHHAQAVRAMFARGGDYLFSVSWDTYFT